MAGRALVACKFSIFISFHWEDGKGESQAEPMCTQSVFQPLPHRLLVFSSTAKVALQRLGCLSFLIDMAEPAGAKPEQDPGPEKDLALSLDDGWMWVTPTSHCTSHDHILIQGLPQHCQQLRLGRALGAGGLRGESSS